MKQYNYYQAKELIDTFALRSWVEKIKITSVSKIPTTDLFLANIKIYGKRLNASQKYANKMFSVGLNAAQLKELKSHQEINNIARATI